MNPNPPAELSVYDSIERAINALEYRVDSVSADLKSKKHYPSIENILKLSVANDQAAIKTLRQFQPEREGI